MLVKADRDLVEIIQFFAARGLEAGYLVPTKTGLEKGIMDAHIQLSTYLRRAGLHDYSAQGRGADAKVILGARYLGREGFLQTKASLYRPETKGGDPRIWISDLGSHAVAGNLLALFAHEGELYVVNASSDGLLESARDPLSPFSRMLDLLAAAKNKPLDDRFSEWNLRLLRSFFSEASKDEEVFLRIDSDLLDQIGQDIGGDRGFLEAVRAGAAWLREDNFVRCVQALVSQRRLRSANYKDPGEYDATYRGHSAPTYLPYLAALVRNDAEGVNAYYAGLQKDLKLRRAFGPPEMGQVEAAWGDLQEWTNGLRGRFGYFKLRRLGGYRLIGVPRSQSILKPGDVEDLARVFIQAEVRPGKDVDDRALSRILTEAKASPGHFSAAFQKALEIPAFEQPIRAAIAATYIDWDGTLPAKRANSRSAGPTAGRGGSAGADTNIGLALAVDCLEPLTISPRWRLPAIQDSGTFEISIAGTAWRGSFMGTEGASTVPSTGSAGEIWKIAERAMTLDQEFGLKCYDAADSEPTKHTVALGQRRLWILFPAFDDVSGSIELQEGDLPGSGQAYLLAPPRNASQLKAYLARETPAYETLAAQGLPEGWLLVCLLDCAALDVGQRLLPDDEDGAHPKPRAIRFIGGRAVRRGYSRLYLPYDLPTIQLDAPSGTKISCSDGIVVEEEAGDGARLVNDQFTFKPLKRFNVRLPHARSASYEIRAVCKGQVIGQAKLRVSGLSGDIVEPGRPFSIDHLGAPVPSNEGLSGVLLQSPIDEGPVATVEPINVRPSALGSVLDEGELVPGARELFLDALARSGGFDYSVARDLLRRLLRTTGESGEPPFILLDLKSRGHLEISTTSRGHMARVHPTFPALYSLPVICGERQVWALAGTMRLAHWTGIAGERQSWDVFRRGGAPEYRGQWRLLIKSDEEADAACARLGFKRVDLPCSAIAEWSAGLRAVRQEILRNMMESIGASREGAQCFNGSKGQFTAKTTGRPCELLKVRDLDTGMDNIYVMADGGKYAFVRDSRWGVWIALDAFAEWASQLEGMAGVHPMPLTYAAKDGTIWLPARISLPSLLERALVLCSGGPPEAILLAKDAGSSSGDRINLHGSNQHVSVKRVYEEMASGKWLAYRWVPECVARVVAEKLGAALDVV